MPTFLLLPTSLHDRVPTVMFFVPSPIEMIAALLVGIFWLQQGYSLDPEALQRIAFWPFRAD